MANVKHAARPARKRRRRRGGSKTLYYILILILLLAAGITLSLTVFFEIESVTAIGTDKYSPSDIVAASGIAPGENMFRINRKSAEDRLLAQFPYIESVSARLKPPHSIQIEITQCKPAAALVQGDEYVLITKEGKLLERGLVFIPEDAPLVKGVDTQGLEPGDMLVLSESGTRDAQRRVAEIDALLSAKEPPEDRGALIAERDALSQTLAAAQSAQSALRMLDYLWDAQKKTQFNMITNVDLTDEYNMWIVYENRLMFNLGTELDLPAKLEFIKEMIDNQLAPGDEGIIDASNLNTLDRLILRRMPIEEAMRTKGRRDRTSDDEFDEPTPELDGAQNEDKPERVDLQDASNPSSS